jgi:hypothetical protein
MAVLAVMAMSTVVFAVTSTATGSTTNEASSHPIGTRLQPGNGGVHPDVGDSCDTGPQ